MLARCVPASFRFWTVAGGVRKAKQVLPALSAEHLPTPVSSVIVCSRFIIWKSALSSGATESKKPLPLFGGRPFGAMPMTTSPVADIEIDAGAAGAEDPGPAPVAAGLAALPPDFGSSLSFPVRKVAAVAVPAPTSNATSTAMMIVVRFSRGRRRGGGAAADRAPGGAYCGGDPAGG